MASGKDLEDLTAEIFGLLTAEPQPGTVSVERDVQMPGADGPRQIDVVIRSKAGPISLTTIVECKDYVKTVDVTTVDALASVMADVRANKAILVTRKGYSKTAKQKAERLGIGLYRANQATDVRAAVTEVPICVRQIEPERLHLAGTAKASIDGTVMVSELLTINGVALPSLAQDYLLAHPDLVSDTEGRHTLPLAALPDRPWKVQAADGAELDVSALEVTFHIRKSQYFGYMSDLTAAVVLHDELAKTRSFLLRGEDFLFDYQTQLKRFGISEELPATPAITANVVIVAEPSRIKGSVTRIS